MTTTEARETTTLYADPGVDRGVAPGAHRPPARAGGSGDGGSGLRRLVRRRPADKWVEATPANQALSLILVMISFTILFLLVNLVFVSQVEHYTSQKSLYSQLRLTLAEGATPVAAVTHGGALVAPGTPVAVMNAVKFGISREVVVEGTAAGQTMKGIGHRRDTVMPCQVGSSVLMARSGAYGGVGSKWAKFQPGNRFTITMGQGVCTYEVTGLRNPGDAAPPLPVGREGHLTLMTAAGRPFMPTEVLRIDAKLVSHAYNKSVSAIPAGAIPTSELPMGIDTGNVFALVLLLEALVAVAIGATWLWHRWGRWQTWIVAGPVGLALGLATASSVDYLLPNLL
jgi:sortase A